MRGSANRFASFVNAIRSFLGRPLSLEGELPLAGLPLFPQHWQKCQIWVATGRGVSCTHCLHVGNTIALQPREAHVRLRTTRPIVRSLWQICQRGWQMTEVSCLLRACLL